MTSNNDIRKIPDLKDFKQRGEESFSMPQMRQTNDFTCFGLTPANQRSICLKVITANGTALIPYSRILDPISYEKNSGILIITSMLNLSLKGSNLHHLIDAIGDHRLAWVKSNTADGLTDELFMRAEEPNITQIRIERQQ